MVASIKHEIALHLLNKDVSFTNSVGRPTYDKALIKEEKFHRLIPLRKSKFIKAHTRGEKQIYQDEIKLKEGDEDDKDHDEKVDYLIPIFFNSNSTFGIKFYLQYMRFLTVYGASNNLIRNKMCEHGFPYRCSRTFYNQFTQSYLNLNLKNIRNFI
jgi:hypothetical protein